MVNRDEIRAAAVIGAGIMGEGIAQSLASGGLSVRLVDLNRQFRKWLRQSACVFSRRPDFEVEWPPE